MRGCALGLRTGPACASSSTGGPGKPGSPLGTEEIRTPLPRWGVSIGGNGVSHPRGGGNSVVTAAGATRPAAISRPPPAAGGRSASSPSTGAAAAQGATPRPRSSRGSVASSRSATSSRALPPTGSPAWSVPRSSPAFPLHKSCPALPPPRTVFWWRVTLCDWRGMPGRRGVSTAVLITSGGQGLLTGANHRREPRCEQLPRGGVACCAAVLRVVLVLASYRPDAGRCSGASSLPQRVSSREVGKGA